MRSNRLFKLPAKERVHLESLDKFAPIPKALKRYGLAFPKDFKALVVVDGKKSPRYILFDARSLWDLLCVFDERLEEKVSARAYLSENPLGWLIDGIENHLPLNPKIVLKLKKSLREAQRLGRVPFEEIKDKLGLG